MSTINLSLWITGLALQAILLVLLFRRRLARRMPVFTFLFGFYLLRAGVLYALSSDSSSVWYGNLYNTLSMADLCLQVLVAVEIAIHALRNTEAWRRDNRLRTAALFSAGIAIAAALAIYFPERGRVPIDRGIIFSTLLMLFLLIWMAVAHVGGAPRRVTEGFVLYGVVATLAGIGRNIAILHRSRGGYAAASYTGTGVYLCVVIFWLFALRNRDDPEMQTARVRRTIAKRAI
jgi:hypothetical protein